MQSRPHGYAAVSETRRCRRQFHFQEPDSQAKARMNRRSGKGRPSAGKLLSQFRQMLNSLYRLSIFPDFYKRQARTLQGRIAKTRAGKPEPPFGFGKLTTTIA